MIEVMLTRCRGKVGQKSIVQEKNIRERGGPTGSARPHQEDFSSPLEVIESGE